MNYIEFTVLKAFTSEFKLRTNPVKAFNGMCVRLTSITFPVIWSSVLISVTREWRYCGLVYKFFLINNIELKCSFVWCCTSNAKRCKVLNKVCERGTFFLKKKIVYKKVRGWTSGRSRPEQKFVEHPRPGHGWRIEKPHV